MRMISRALRALGLALALIGPPAAHAGIEDCWLLSPDAGGGLQSWIGSLTPQCYSRPSEIVSKVVNYARAAWSTPVELSGVLFETTAIRAEVRPGVPCPPSETGGASCFVNYTARRTEPDGTQSSWDVNGTSHFWYSHAYCPTGQRAWMDAGLSVRCTAVSQISLTGPSSTKALPAGPVLPHIATVTSGGAPLPDTSVSIQVGSGAVYSGTTDGNGQFRFNYVPPQRKAVEQLTASCNGCTNTASKTITVEACDACSVANPIVPATGEKVQAEADWADSAAHPLSFTRHYRSYGNIDAGLGSTWSHNHGALLQRTAEEATVRFGDGTKVIFSRTAEGQPWVAHNGIDSLTDTADGAVYYRASDESLWTFAAASGAVLWVRERNGWTKTYTYSGNQLTRITNAFGRALQFTYDAKGRLQQASTPDGQSIRYAYDNAGRLVTAFYPGGATRSYHYEDARTPLALTGITDEAGSRYASFTYDEAGRATRSEHAGGAQSYSVNYGGAAASSGSIATGNSEALLRRSVTVTDPLGNPQAYTYQGGDGQVRLQQSSSAADGGQVASRTFGAGNLPLAETDFLGVETRYTWDAARRLKLSTTHAAGRPEAWTSSTQWHPQWRLPLSIEEPQRITAYAYDNAGNVLTEQVTDRATGQSRTRAWTYTAQGLPETHTDARGKRWSFGYDNAGSRTSITDPLGQTTRFTYDGAGRVLTQTQPGGLVTSFTYDTRGRVLTQTRGGEATTYSYTAAGQLASAQLPNGYRITYTYDAAQRLIAANDNRGASIAYTLDGQGNRISEEVKDANGNIALATRRVINALNRVAALQGATGQTSQFAYDANGQQTSATDPLNQTTRQTLDALGRVAATTFPDNAAATQEWAAPDQLAAVTDPKGVRTSYQYNAYGEVTAETSPDIGTVRYERDAAGDVSASTDAKGQSSAISRDALGRVRELRFADNQTQRFTYTPNGDLSRVEDASGATAYERDSLGRVTVKTQDVNDTPATPSRFKLSYGFAGGDLASLTYPSGLVVSYQRQAGRITGITTREPGKGKPTVAFITDLTHTALGQPKAWRWSNGDTASRSFDQDGRMTANEFARYVYDQASRITGVTQDLWASSTATGTVTYYTTPVQWSAGYDSRNRLTRFDRDGQETRYAYDANSNRLTAVEKVTSDTDLDGTFDSTDFATHTSQQLRIEPDSNRLLGLTQTLTTTNNHKTKSVVTTPVAYTLDANGALTSDGLRSFEYDAANHLQSVRIFKSGEEARIGYLTNALGQRVFKGEPTAVQTLPNEATLGAGFIDWLKKQFGWMFALAAANTSIGTAYLFGDADIPAWAILGEYDNGSATGAGRTEYIWLPTEDGSAIPVGLYRNGKFFAIHTDHLGTPRLMTNEANKPVWQWPYSAFGNNKPTGILAATPNPKAALTNQPVLLKATNPTQELGLRFPGQMHDQETGWNYNYLRYYWAMQGRYTQPDPIGQAGGPNLYGYVGGSPLSRIDPMGLAALEIPLPSIPLPNWITVPGSRLIGGLGLILSLGGDTPKSGTAGIDECPPGSGGKDPCKGLRDQMQDHERKLREYMANPMSMDNKGFLAGALDKGNQALYDTIYASRVASLAKQIANFKKQLEECERQNGKP